MTEQSMESIIIPPTPERLRHDAEVGAYERDKVDSVTGAVEHVRQHTDYYGNPGAPWEVPTTVQLLWKRGLISATHRNAGHAYMDDWDIAGIENLRAAPLEIVGHGPDSITDKRIAAHGRWWKATQALGGLGSPCERAAWYILGMRANLAQWVAIEGGRITSDTAKGLLIGALGVLAQHYGLEGRAK